MLVVTGPPASGKSSLAEELARRRGLPLVMKDDVKEALADALRATPATDAVFAVLYRLVERQLATAGAVIADANFDAEAAERALSALRWRVPFRLVQVFCGGEPDVLADRYRERAESGERHPVHADEDQAGEVEAAIRSGSWRPLSLEGTLIELDLTSSGEADDAVARVEAVL